MLYSSIASLLVMGGLDSRPRLGGYVMASDSRVGGYLKSCNYCVNLEDIILQIFIGTICNILNKTGTVMVQFHDTNKVEQLTLSPLKPVSSLHFQLDKIPLTNSFLDTWATLMSMASLTQDHKTQYSKNSEIKSACSRRKFGCNFFFNAAVQIISKDGTKNVKFQIHQEYFVKWNEVLICFRFSKK